MEIESDFPHFEINEKLMTHFQFIFLFLQTFFENYSTDLQSSDYHMSKQNVSSDSEKKEKKKEDDEKLIQEKLEAHATIKSNKENENLILMNQNYHKYFDQCECSSIAVPSRILNNAKTNWMSSEKLNELRRKAHEAVRMHKVFILKGFFHTVRKALIDRGWVRALNWVADFVFENIFHQVEKIDVHKARVTSSSGFLLEDLVQALPPRRPGESKKAWELATLKVPLIQSFHPCSHIQKCERSILSRFLEHSPIDLLWCVRRDKSGRTFETQCMHILFQSI